MEYIYNSLHNKAPKGPCRAGFSVTYTLKVSRNCTCDNVYFVLIDDGDNTKKEIKMPLHAQEGDYDIYRATIKFDKAGLFWYHFKITYNIYTWYLCKNQMFDVEPGPEVKNSFAQVVFEKQSCVDKKYNSGIIYHIFVDRFKRSGKVTGRPGIILRNDWGGEITKNSNDFLIINQECFGGNFKGIIEKLAYIKSLGAKTIMLSPIFEANSYHKYNTANLDKIDEILGGETMFDVLVAEAKKYDIQILLDGVFNHCGNDSIYFKEAITNPKSEYYNWFVFEEYPNKYSSWWGFNTLPQFNESDTHLQNFIAGPNGIIAKYMKKEILGFRLDVADELTDPYLNKICAKIRQIKPDALITGEVWEDAATKLAYSKRRHYFGGHQFNSVMNYPLKNAIIDYVLNRNAEGLASTFFMLQDHYPEGVQHNLMNFLGTHDTIRILTALQSNNQGNGFKLLKIASAIQYCAPGVPSVFYGDEAGVIGGEAPFCRVCFPWGSENKEILKWYRKLGKLREMDVFIDGDCNVLFSHNGVFVFERKKTSTRIILAVNCGQEIFKLNLENSMVNFETGKIIKDYTILNSNEFVILVASDKIFPAAAGQLC